MYVSAMLNEAEPKTSARASASGVSKNIMTTSNSIYGAIPPANIGAQGSSGHILTANGVNGTNWMNQGMNLTSTQSALAIRNNDRTVVAFNTDGTITTKAGTISADEWITVIKVMKQLIMDMSKDQELASKYPYIQDAAHTWMMNELKGKE